MLADAPNNRPVCLITGGSSGIGLATAKKFASEGYQISICGRRPEALSDAAQQIDSAAPDNLSLRCLKIEADLNQVADAKSVFQQTVAQFGRVDVLINNAGSAPLSPFENITSDVFESTINLNVRSQFYLTQLVWADLKKRPNPEQGRGVVVNVSSMAAVDPFPGFSIYGACKAWSELLTTALATEGKELGLRVCAVRPGAVETPMLRNLFPDFPADQCVSPDEIAAVIWQCVCSPQTHPSGQTFTVTKQPDNA